MLSKRSRNDPDWFVCTGLPWSADNGAVYGSDLPPSFRMLDDIRGKPAVCRRLPGCRRQRRPDAHDVRTVARGDPSRSAAGSLRRAGRQGAVAVPGTKLFDACSSRFEGVQAGAGPKNPRREPVARTASGLHVHMGGSKHPAPDAAGQPPGAAARGRTRSRGFPDARLPVRAHPDAWAGRGGGCNGRPAWTITITARRSPPPGVPLIARLPPPARLHLRGKGNSMANHSARNPKSSASHCGPPEQEAESLADLSNRPKPGRRQDQGAPGT